MACLVHRFRWLGRWSFFRVVRLLLVDGALNAETGLAGERVVARTHLSVGRGFYDTNLTVANTCATAGAIIHYTTEGSAPNATKGLVYGGPVEISKTTVLRTVAVKTGWTPASVDTQTYIFPNGVIASRPMRPAITKHPLYGSRMREALLSLPSLSLVAGGKINGNERVKASIEWLAPGSPSGFQVDCGVSNYGGDYTDFAKKHFRLYFKCKFGASKLRFPLFTGCEHGVAAVDEFDQLELRGGSHDMVQRGFYLSNIFADDSLLEMGHLSPHGRFVHLYLNGTYWGVFHLRERWGADMHRRYPGGGSSNYESINGNLNVGGWADPGVPYDGDGSAWAKVRSLRKNYHAVQSWVDVPQ